MSTCGDTFTTAMNTPSLSCRAVMLLKTIENVSPGVDYVSISKVATRRAQAQKVVYILFDLVLSCYTGGKHFRGRRIALWLLSVKKVVELLDRLFETCRV